MICKSQWVEQTEKAFEQTILNKDKINKVNTGSKNNSFLFPTLTFQLCFLLWCANWPFRSFFSTFFMDKLGKICRLRWKNSSKLWNFTEVFRGGGGEERQQTCPRLRCQQSRVKCFLLMDFFAMFTSLMFK